MGVHYWGDHVVGDGRGLRLRLNETVIIMMIIISGERIVACDETQSESWQSVISGRDFDDWWELGNVNADYSLTDWDLCVCVLLIKREPFFTLQ